MLRYANVHMAAWVLRKNIKKIIEDLEREDVIESAQPIVHFCSTIITGTEKTETIV